MNIVRRVKNNSDTDITKHNDWSDETDDINIVAWLKLCLQGFHSHPSTGYFNTQIPKFSE